MIDENMGGQDLPGEVLHQNDALRAIHETLRKAVAEAMDHFTDDQLLAFIKSASLEFRKGDKA